MLAFGIISNRNDSVHQGYFSYNIHRCGWWAVLDRDFATNWAFQSSTKLCRSKLSNGCLRLPELLKSCNSRCLTWYLYMVRQVHGGMLYFQTRLGKDIPKQLTELRHSGPDILEQTITITLLFADQWGIAAYLPAKKNKAQIHNACIYILPDFGP